MRRRAYVESHVPFDDAFAIAFRWAGEEASIRVGDTRTVDLHELEDLGVPITCGSSRSRFRGTPRGAVIAVEPNQSEVLEVERFAGVEGMVVVTAHGKPPMVPPEVSGHAAWITAFGAQYLGGKEIEPIPEASAPLKGCQMQCKHGVFGTIPTGLAGQEPHAPIVAAPTRRTPPAARGTDGAYM